MIIESPFVNFRKIVPCKNLYRTGKSIDGKPHAGFLKTVGITTYFDLRNLNKERVAINNRQYRKYGIEYMCLQIRGNDSCVRRNEFPTESDYVEYYYSLFRESKAEWIRLFTMLSSNAQGKFLIGCSFGKDRTGIAVYLLLRLLGKSSEDAAQDYALSADYLSGNERLRRQYQYKKQIAFNPTENIILLFDEALMNCYSNIDALSAELKLDKNRIDTLKRHFL